VCKSFCCVVGGLLWAGVVGGCAQQASYRVERAVAAAPAADPYPATVTPGKVVLNWAALPPLGRVDQALGHATAPSGYRNITAEQAQCRAAACAVQGNLLAAEQRLVCSTHRDRRGAITPGGALLSNLLAARSVYERNEASGKALELFYRLAEAQLQRGVLDRSLQEVDRSIADYKQLQQRGLALPDDDSALQRQRSEVLAKKVQLETQAHQAEGQLSRLMAVPFDPRAPLSPTADLSLAVAPVDLDTAVVEGLALRADLCMLRVLCECLNQDSLPAVRGAMQQIGVPLSGSAPPEVRRLLKNLDESQLACEQQTRQLQCCLARADQTRAAEEDIRHAGRDVMGKLRLAALARQKWASWQQRAEDLREKQKAGKEVTSFDVGAAQMKALEAESDAIAAAAAWKVAVVKLKQAQGLLAHECGHHLPPGCACASAPSQAASAEQRPLDAAPLPPDRDPAAPTGGEKTAVSEPAER
jgi:hypothetical protein